MFSCRARPAIVHGAGFVTFLSHGLEDAAERVPGLPATTPVRRPSSARASFIRRNVYGGKVRPVNWQAFVASLVHSLAWPAGVLVVVIVLRKPHRSGARPQGPTPKSRAG
jgi:hypothetical protein